LPSCRRRGMHLCHRRTSHDATTHRHGRSEIQTRLEPGSFLHSKSQSNVKSNQITFNEHVTNVHACSERGQMIRCSNVTETFVRFSQQLAVKVTSNDNATYTCKFTILAGAGISNQNINSINMLK